MSTSSLQLLKSLFASCILVVIQRPEQSACIIENPQDEEFGTISLSAFAIRGLQEQILKIREFPFSIPKRGMHFSPGVACNLVAEVSDIQVHCFNLTSRLELLLFCSQKIPVQSQDCLLETQLVSVVLQCLLPKNS